MLGGTVATSSDLNGLPGVSISNCSEAYKGAAVIFEPDDCSSCNGVSTVGDGSEKEWEMQFFVNYGKGSMVTYSTLLGSGWRNGATVRVLRRLAAAAISSRL